MGGVVGAFVIGLRRSRSSAVFPDLSPRCSPAFSERLPQFSKMAKGRDKTSVSIWFWLLSMVVMAIPLVNIIMTLVWAFTGTNDSRKNYFKALIIMFCVMMGLMICLFTLGMSPLLLEKIREVTSAPTVHAR